MEPRSRPDGRQPAGGASAPVVRIGCALAVGLVALQTAAHLVNFALLDESVGTVDADREDNAVTWLGSVAIFTAAGMTVALAVAEPRWRVRLGFLAAIFALFSLDEYLALHELLSTSMREELFGDDNALDRVVWPIVLLPVLAAALLIPLSVARELTRSPARVVRLGLGLLALAVAAEVASAAVHSGDRFTETAVDAVQVSIEEGAELGGWILIATGFAAAANLRVGSPAARADTTSAIPQR